MSPNRDFEIQVEKVIDLGRIWITNDYNRSGDDIMPKYEISEIFTI